MLIVSRKENERVFIKLPDGRKICVSVGEINGGCVRLGFEADSDILVAREEVAPMIFSEQEQQ